MANIILEKSVVPELLQKEVNSKTIFDTASKILSDQENYKLIKQQLDEVKIKLANPGASAKAAKIIYEMKHAN